MKLFFIINIACLSWSSAQNSIVSFGQDFNSSQAGVAYIVSEQLYTETSAGHSITLMSGDSNPKIFFKLKKKNHANRNLENKAKKEYLAHVANYLSTSIQRQSPNPISQIDVPAVLNEISHYTDAKSTRLFLIGSRVWVENETYSFINFKAVNPDERFRIPSKSAVQAGELNAPFSTARIKGDLSGMTITWVDPAVNEVKAPAGYYEVADAFWSHYFNQLSISLMPVVKDSQRLSEQLNGKVKALNSAYPYDHEEKQMLTLAELSQIGVEPVIQTSMIYCLDNSGSMGDYINRVAAMLKKEQPKKNRELAVILFTNAGLGHGAQLLTKTGDPLDASKQLLNAQSQGGIDNPDTLSHAMETTLQLLKTNGVSGAKVVIAADELPLDSGNLDKTKHFRNLMQEIHDLGHKIIFVKARGDLDTKSFLPEFVNVYDL